HRARLRDRGRRGGTGRKALRSPSYASDRAWPSPPPRPRPRGRHGSRGDGGAGTRGTGKACHSRSVRVTEKRSNDLEAMNENAQTAALAEQGGEQGASQPSGQSGGQS